MEAFGTILDITERKRKATEQHGEKSMYEMLPVDLAEQRMEYVRRAIDTRELPMSMPV